MTKIGVINVSLVTQPNKSWTLRMQFVGGGSEHALQRWSQGVLISPGGGGTEVCEGYTGGGATGFCGGYTGGGASFFEQITQGGARDFCAGYTGDSELSDRAWSQVVLWGLHRGLMF